MNSSTQLSETSTQEEHSECPSTSDETQASSKIMQNSEMKWSDFEKGEIQKSRVNNFKNTIYYKVIDVNRLYNLLNSNSNKGVCGSHNLGNTCFMNSAIQCLSNSIELTTYFLTGDYKQDINKNNSEGLDGKLSKEWYNLLYQLWMGNHNAVDASRVKAEIAKKARIFSGFNQNDSHEFIIFFLDNLNEELNRNKTKIYKELDEKQENETTLDAALRFWEYNLSINNSIITDLFTGQFHSIIQCSDCNWISNTFHTFQIMSLPIPIKYNYKLFYIPKYELGKASKVSIRITELTLFGGLTEFLQKYPYLHYKSKSIRYDAILDSRVHKSFAPDSNCYESFKQNKFIFAYATDETSDKMDTYELILKTEKPNSASSYPRILFLHNDITYNDLLKKIYYHARKYIKFPIEENEQKFRDALEIYIKDSTNESEIFELLDKEYDLLFNSEDKPEEIKTFLDNLPFTFSIDSQNESKQYLILYNKQTKDQEFKNSEIYTIPNNADTIQDLLTKLKNENLIFNLQINSTNQHAFPKLVFNICVTVEDNHYHNYLTLEDCLNAFYEKEKLSVGNEWNCKKCKGKVQGLKQIKLFYLPKILVIHFNRFVKAKSSFGYMSSYFQKNNETIQFPIDELDLSKHVTGPQEEAKYSLYGVCQHFGEYGGGHYVAKCKNGDSWYNYNDSSCHEVNVNEIVNSSAYILFYRRKD